MNRSLPLLIASFLLLQSGCSMKYTYPSERAAAPMTDLEALTAAGQDEGLICERTQVIGSRLGERVCSTRAQREERTRRSREAMDEVQRKATGPTIQEG